MKKTSIYLAPEIDEALARRAVDEGISKAELIRRTLAGAVQRPPRPKPSVGVYKGGPPHDVAENAEKYLGELGFGED